MIISLYANIVHNASHALPFQLIWC